MVEGFLALPRCIDKQRHLLTDSRLPDIIRQSLWANRPILLRLSGASLWRDQSICFDHNFWFILNA
jgi:hypothetical protein